MSAAASEERNRWIERVLGVRIEPDRAAALTARLASVATGAGRTRTLPAQLSVDLADGALQRAAQARQDGEAAWGQICLDRAESELDEAALSAVDGSGGVAAWHALAALWGTRTRKILGEVAATKAGLAQSELTELHSLADAEFAAFEAYLEGEFGRMSGVFQTVPAAGSEIDRARAAARGLAERLNSDPRVFACTSNPIGADFDIAESAGLVLLKAEQVLQQMAATGI